MNRCDTITDAGTRCTRAGCWTVSELLMRGKCYQHALAEARAQGGRTMVDLSTGRLRRVADIPEQRRSRPFVLPTTYDAVMVKLPKLRTLTELAKVIGVVIGADPTFPGFGDRDSDLRTLIRATRKRLKKTAADEDLAAHSPGWAPEGLGAIAAAAAARSGVTL